jgi:Methyltransferase domain
MMKDATWFQLTAQPNFAKHLMPARGKPCRFLQIGVYKGDASQWMMDNVLTHPDSFLDDVDPWGTNDYHELDALEPDWDTIFWDYRNRMRPYTRVRAWHCTSNKFFASPQPDTAEYDFIYIDGAHDCISVLEDGVHAYQRLEVGGLLAFDDYTYQTEDRDPYKAPALAIDAIRTLYKDRLVVIDINSQVWFTKVA